MSNALNNAIHALLECEALSIAIAESPETTAALTVVGRRTAAEAAAAADGADIAAAPSEAGRQPEAGVSPPQTQAAASGAWAQPTVVSKRQPKSMSVSCADFALSSSSKTGDLVEALGCLLTSGLAAVLAGQECAHEQLDDVQWAGIFSLRQALAIADLSGQRNLH